MYQIDNSTAAATIPASTPAGTAGFFTDGNPATGVAATIMPAEFMNMIMMEVINVLGAAGITPSKSNFTQLITAIRAVNRQVSILADTGVAGTYSAVNSPALSALPTTGYIQRVNITNPNPGASTYSPDGLAAKPIYGLGLQPLQGGELVAGVAVLMYLVQAGVNGGNGAWILIESLGGAQQVATGAKSQHAAQVARVGTDGGLSFRRLNHNGNFNINQRIYVSGTATTGTNQLTLDRWKVKVLGQSVTFSPSGIGNAVVAPAGGLEQVVEGKDVVGGTYCASWIGAGTLTVNGVATAKGASFTLPTNTNATFVIVGAVSQFQVELGTVPTQFEFWPTAVELAICQRYCYVLFNNGENVFAGWGFMLTTTAIAGCVIKLPVTMRAKPTIGTIVPGDTGTILAYSSAPSTAGALSAIYFGGDTVTISFNSGAPATVGYPCAYFLQGGSIRLVFSADI